MRLQARLRRIRARLRQPAWRGVGSFAIVAGAATAVVATGVLLTQGLQFQDLRQHLGSTAALLAAQTDGDAHQALRPGTDPASPEYRRLVAPFRAALRADPDLRFAFSAVVRQDTMFFVLDGAPVDSINELGASAFAPVGEAMYPAPAGMVVALTRDTVVVDDSVTFTAYGAGVRALAPIHRADGQVVGVAGVTLSGERYVATTRRLRRVAVLAWGVGLLAAVGTGFATWRIERRRMATEDALDQARRDAEAAARTKAAFLANMSHEIRTPLHGVLGMSEALLAVPRAPADTQALEVIDQSARGLLRILDDVLDVSKLEAGRVALERVPFSPRKVCDQVAQLFSVTAAQKGIHVEVDERPGIPARLVGDPTRLRQVLTNLVGNAVKFTSRGRVQIRLEPGAPRLDGGVRVRFVVKDTGIGIRPEVLPNLFEQFTQAESSTTRRYGGTGLGLAIVKELSALMAGTLHVESVVGMGSTFTLELPLDVPVVPADRGDGEPASDPRPAMRGVLADRSARALVVDDNPMNLMVARAMLGTLGLEADTAANGAEALGKLASERYDVVLMDVHMPELDGLAATRALRSREGPNQAALVLGLSASVGEEDRRQALAAGMDDFAGKPIELQALRVLLTRWLVSRA